MWICAAFDGDLPWCSIGHRHHTGVRSPTRWRCKSCRCCRRWRVALAAAKWKKEKTCHELTGKMCRARLVVLAAEVGSRWLAETARFLVVQSQGGDSARAPPNPRGGSMVATVERHVGLLCSEGFRPLLVRLLGSGVLPQHPL